MKLYDLIKYIPENYADGRCLETMTKADFEKLRPSGPDNPILYQISETLIRWTRAAGLIPKEPEKFDVFHEGDGETWFWVSMEMARRIDVYFSVIDEEISEDAIVIRMNLQKSFREDGEMQGNPEWILVFRKADMMDLFVEEPSDEDPCAAGRRQLSGWIQVYLKAADKRQRSLAEHVGMDHAELCRFLRGEKRFSELSDTYASRIAEGLGISLSRLYELENLVPAHY